MNSINSNIIVVNREITPKTDSNTSTFSVDRSQKIFKILKEEFLFWKLNKNFTDVVKETVRSYMLNLLSFFLYHSIFEYRTLIRISKVKK